MSDVVAMTRLDLLSSRPYVKQGLMLVAAAGVVALVMDDATIVLPMIAMYAILMSSYPFAIGDKNDLDTLYAVVPVRRSAQLVGRYLYALVLFGFALAAGVVLLVAATLLKGAELPDASEAAILASVCFALFAVMVALQYPIYIVLGYMRARLAGMLPFLLLVVVGMGFQSRFEGLTPPPVWTAVPILVGGGVLALAVSVLVAARLPCRDAR